MEQNLIKLINKLPYLFLVIFVYYCVIHNFNNPPIFIFDEALYANNAIDLSNNGDYFNLNENGNPNIDNVKPPFVIWCQSLCIQLFGINEFAIRLPSILSACIIFILIYSFCKKHFNNIVAFVAVAVLSTTQGYIRLHVVKTGDLDGVLSLFITAYLLLLADFFLTGQKKVFSFYLKFYALVFFAFLCKGIAGLMPLFGVFVFLIFKKDYRKQVFSYLNITCFLGLCFCCLFYYAIRNYFNPSHFNIVLQTELLRFTNNIMPWHNQPFAFYFKNFITKHFQYYYYFIIFSLIVRKRKDSFFINYSIVICAIYLVLISFPIVKLDWYDAPIYPILSITASKAIHSIILLCKNFNKQLGILVLLTLLSCYFIFPFRKIIIDNKNVVINEYEKNGNAINLIFKNSPNNKISGVFMTAPHPSHFYQLKFYLKKINTTYKKEIKLIDKATDLKAGQIVVCENSTDFNTLEKFFYFTRDKSANFTFYKLIEKK